MKTGYVLLCFPFVSISQGCIIFIFLTHGLHTVTLSLHDRVIICCRSSIVTSFTANSVPAVKYESINVFIIYSLADTTEGTYMKSIDVVTSQSTSGGGCASMAWVT